MRLRQLFEALRGRLDGREREAATLCYLQGLSRAEAAARMGVSEARMRKLMEGRGPGRPGVAGKVGMLVQRIRDGDWCDEQGSLMRALAYGVLDPGGERYRLALMHHRQCPACRAYVTSLRGLAAALPPVLAPWAIAAAALARAAEGVSTSGATVAGSGVGGVGGGGAVGGGAVGGGAVGGGAVGGGSVAVSGAAGAAGAGGAAGGGWLIGAGPLSAKLAVGCLLALGVGAGCAALEAGHPAPAYRRGRGRVVHSSAHASVRAGTAAQLGDLTSGVARQIAAGGSTGAGASAPLTSSAKASREFGPEQALAERAGTPASVGEQHSAIARSAISGSGSAAGARRSTSSSGTESTAPVRSVAQPSTGDSTAAQREFSPG